MKTLKPAPETPGPPRGRMIRPDPAPSVKVGDRYICERRHLAGSIDHVWTDRIYSVTPKRAYFAAGTWFALDDPKRVVRPKYCDFVTTARPEDT